MRTQTNSLRYERYRKLNLGFCSPFFGEKQCHLYRGEKSSPTIHMSLQDVIQQTEFAVNLAEVTGEIAEPEYQDPTEFFARTYLTEGMRRLLVYLPLSD